MPKRALFFLFLLRIFLGLFWIDHGMEKIADRWLTTNKLKPRLMRDLPTASEAPKVYLKNFAIPASGVLRYLITFGEIAVGLALLVGFWLKPAGWGAAFMLVNFKFAGSRLDSIAILGDAYFFPILLATLFVAYYNWDKTWTIKQTLPILDRYEVK